MKRPWRLGFAFVAGLALLAQQPVPRPGPRELCPLCGMLVAKYPNWAATVVWNNGRAHHFDGAKDLFKFLQAPLRFAPEQKTAALAGVYVTEFYGLKRIAASTAFFVIGSDVLGPMGHELVPLATAEDAAEFSKDHKGIRILRFKQIDGALLAGLDSGKFGPP